MGLNPRFKAGELAASLNSAASEKRGFAITEWVSFLAVCHTVKTSPAPLPVPLKGLAGEEWAAE